MLNFLALTSLLSMKYVNTLSPSFSFSLSAVIFDMRILLLLAFEENFGITPSTMFSWMKVVSNSSETPLNITPMKSSSVFNIPCFMA